MAVAHLIITDPITITVAPASQYFHPWLRIESGLDKVSVYVDDPGEVVEALRAAADSLEAAPRPAGPDTSEQEADRG